MKISYDSLALCLFSVMTLFCAAGAVQAGDVDVDVRASAGVEFDDNFTYVETNRPSDFITTLKVGMNLNYENKRSAAQISADIVQHVFADHTEESNTAEYVSVDLSREFSKYDQIRLTDTFSHTQDPYSFADEFGRVAGRYSSYRNRFDVMYDKELTEKFSAELGYGNDLDLAGEDNLVDSVAHRFRAEGTYAFNSERMIFGTYDFLHRTLDPGDAANINSLSGGMRQFFTEQLSLEGRAGVDLIDDYEGDVTAHPFFSATLADRIDGRTTAYLNFTQRHSTTPYAADVFDSWRISGTIDSQVLKKLRVSSEAFYGQGEYVGADVEDYFLGAGIELTYDILDNIKGNLSYEYSQTMSNISSREYTRNAVFLGVSTEY